MRQPTKATEIQRVFVDIPKDKELNPEELSVLFEMRVGSGATWDELLLSDRIMIFAEAGAGKTYECKETQERLWNEGHPAFYVELAVLAGEPLDNLLSGEELERFEEWKRSQSETAYFFLDSVDELKLTLGKFDTALTRLNRALSGNLGRAKIVVTSRPVPVDQAIFRARLPIPPASEPAATAGEFADIAMNRRNAKNDPPQIPPWRNVWLAQLTDEQVAEFARLEGVTDVQKFQEHLRRLNAEEFARRPQDLIELCQDWRASQGFRTRTEQVKNNIEIKLKPRTDRPEPGQLTPEEALEGASRLALATLLARKLTIRHSLEADKGGEPGTALEPATILPDWTPQQRETLLQRGLFGFTSYGRVRFHHRSVIEFLAAKRLKALLDRGSPIRAIKRLLFAKTAQGVDVVRPSMRPVAAWLAATERAIFDEILKREPELLVQAGDPTALSVVQRAQVLRAFVERYGQGGWRGHHFPYLQVIRFANPDLAPVVKELWDAGVSNPEARDLLLTLIGQGELSSCADIAFSVAEDASSSRNERIEGVRALVNLKDDRVSGIVEEMKVDSEKWPNDLIKPAILDLFPEHTSAADLSAILRRTSENPNAATDISWSLPNVIMSRELGPEMVDQLLRELLILVTEETLAEKGWVHLVSERQHLVTSLAALVVKKLRSHREVDDEFARQIAVVVRLLPEDYRGSDWLKEIKEWLAIASTAIREKIFWAENAYVNEHYPGVDPYRRLHDIFHDGAMQVRTNPDEMWVLRNLADTSLSFFDRAMMFDIHVIYFSERTFESRKSRVDSARNLISDSAKLLEIADRYSTPTEESEEMKAIMANSEKRRLEHDRQESENHQSWANFWSKLNEDPDSLFSEGDGPGTAWNLWRAMAATGDNSREAGWNRRFIERHFGGGTADRLRLALMKFWRSDRPTLASERDPKFRNTYLVRWTAGVAAIAAEAEDSDWATKLSHDEAELAARYVPLQLNGFPSWFEALAKAQPIAVDNVLGEELTRELRWLSKGDAHTVTLQNIRNSSKPVIDLFLPRLSAWLDEAILGNGPDDDQEFNAIVASEIIEILLTHGGETTIERLRKFALSRVSSITGRFSEVWLPILMRFNPVEATELLEKCLDSLPEGEAYQQAQGWIASLFGRQFRGEAVDLSNSQFTPHLLLKLARLSYRYINPSKDKVHEGAYSPDLRDNAESGRGALFNALMATTGEDGWNAKRELAADPQFKDLKDRAYAIAIERTAEESDLSAWKESEIITLDAKGELPPNNRDDMYALLADRIDDLEDLMFQDDSPRENWGGITEEKLIRREIARELRNRAFGAYKVDQESVTADEKERDIRLSSTGSDQEGVIEIKIGDKGRSGKELRDAIREQLVDKYLAPENRRCGCFLVTLSEDRKWEHPDTGQKLDFGGLIRMLNEACDKIMREMGGSVRIFAVGLDLRPRLKTESEAANLKGQKSQSAKKAKT